MRRGLEKESWVGMCEECGVVGKVGDEGLCGGFMRVWMGMVLDVRDIGGMVGGVGVGWEWVGIG